MIKQKLIEKLNDAKMRYHIAYDEGLTLAIDLIKSHDFGDADEDTALLKAQERFPVGSRIVPKIEVHFIEAERIITNVYREVNGVIYLQYKRKDKNNFWEFDNRNPAHDFDPLVLAPHPSEEVRAIEKEIEAAKQSLVLGLNGVSEWRSEQSKANYIWVLEQRLKEAKGER